MPPSCSQLMPVGRADAAATIPDNSFSANLRNTVVEDFLAELTVTDIQVDLLQADAGGAESPLPGAGDAFFFVTEGAWRCRFSSAVYEISRGDLLHIGWEETCALDRAKGAAVAAGILVRYQARISETMVMSELMEFPAILSVGLQSRVRHYLAEAAHLARTAPVGHQQCLRSLVTLVLMALVRDHLPETNLLLTRRRVVQLRRLLPAIRVLRRDLGASSVDFFARRCGLSVAQFRRLFHSVFEQSPTQYIQQMRVREACRLLHYTDRTVSEICLQIGYEQPSHFHKTFKKFTGVTPRSYREEF